MVPSKEEQLLAKSQAISHDVSALEMNYQALSISIGLTSHHDLKSLIEKLMGQSDKVL